tara:strand:+ start:1944 stop:3854 length:1911 start_codon:yes stop_codon:yes gene_type:complete
MIARLKLNRLSVHRGPHLLYDELFHDGVNIIHGDNGSGKTTIADFIYFALGGDLQEWRKEAALAHYVLAEIVAGEAVLTLRRDVSDTGKRPMQIYFGRYEDALVADLRNWETFPYSRPEKGYSFSQILFRAIGVPEAISDGLSNITMHQLLRILYSDQLTPIQRIFRVEPFDTWQIRQAVGDLLCGIGGYDLYALQLFLRDLEREFSEVSTRLKSLMAVVSSYGDKVLAEHISDALNGANVQRGRLQERLLELLGRSDDGDAGADADQLAKRQRRDVLKARTEVTKLSDAMETLEYEITDAEQFIDHLRAAVDEFDDASMTFFALGAVRFEFCPSCFSPLAESHKHGDEHCHLCGVKSVAEHDKTRALAVKLDLQMQINESLRMQDEREHRKLELKSQLRSASSSLRAIVSASEIGRGSAASKIETLVADISRQLGYLDREVEQLQQRVALAEEISRLSEDKSLLNARISEMKDRIQSVEISQKQRRSIAYTSIAENMKYILGRDLAQHSDFEVIESTNFSFSEDWISVNGDKSRVGSASGMVVLKNSFLLSLFMTSLKDTKFNLPRFMLMDNIEDKGMVQERSWNFQRLIVEVCNKIDVPNQIIFSTSKIAPELAETALVVGGKYTKNSHTLNIL